MSTNGEMKAFDVVDLRSLVRDPDWTTLINLKGGPDRVRGILDFEEIDFCCPLEVKSIEFVISVFFTF
jgi:hypothetical protein